MPIVGVPGSPIIPTVQDIINRAFRFIHVLGDGEVLTASESTDALIVLNGIIEQANIDKLLGYYRAEVIFSTIPNQSVYTIGPSVYAPDISAPRPVEILSGFSRRDGVDIPLFVAHKDDYDRIQVKNIGIAGWEQVVYYEPTWPKGTATFYMKPLDTMTEIHLSVMAEIPQFTSLNDAVSLPPTYTFWLVYKLGERLSPEYGAKFTTKMEKLLTETEGALKRNNIKPFPVATNETAGLSEGTGKYNVYTDGMNR